MVIFQKHDTKTMNIAVYTGSFNPMHIGHLSVLRYLLDEGGYDMVYLIVSPQNPFKDSSLADSGEKRYEAACRSVEEHGFGSRVKVEDIELKMEAPSYTIRTLDALQKREPQNSFTLAVGGDNLHELPLWKEGKRILTQYGVVVYPRSGRDIEHDCAVLKQQHREEELRLGKEHKALKIKLLKQAPLVDISSTQLREMLEGGKDISNFV